MGKRIIPFLMLLFLMILLGFYGVNHPSIGLESSSAPTIMQEREELPFTSHPERTIQLRGKATFVQTDQLTLAAIGDVLIHSTVYHEARTASGSYDFAPFFEDVKQYLSSADITFANSESIIGGQGLGLSTYPLFNSPYEVGDALKEAGVDVVSMANNHTLDRGEAAILNATNHWDSLGVKYAGVSTTAVGRDDIPIIERKNIKLAFLAYTYGTNGQVAPKGKEYLVNRLHKDRIITEVERASQLADVVVVSYHFGTEDQPLPNAEQKYWVDIAVNAGAQIILGHHPHVLQPPAWVQGEDGKRAFVFYSLGNFLSGQKEIPQKIGAIAAVTIKKERIGTGEATIAITSPQVLPTYVSSVHKPNFKVIPLYHVTEEELPNAQSVQQSVQAHLTQWIPELRVYLEPPEHQLK